MKTYGIVGFPLTHTFSKIFFTQKFQKEGIPDTQYEIYPIGSAGEIKNLIAEDPSIAGLNVTIPYKQSILRYIDDLDKLPEGLKACNCIRIVSGRTVGYNTDVIGFEKSLVPYLEKQYGSALILGNGGAAAAIKFVLKKRKLSYKIVGRNIKDDVDLTYGGLTKSIVEQHTLIINTTPLGTFPNVNDCPDIPYQFLTARHLLYDLVYNPEKTLFLQKGEAFGAAIKNGYEMLVLQAEESWRIWNEG